MLVKNVSKRSEQQQQLPVRSLVTLTVKEWVRSQMNTLFWDFCKINNPCQVWKEGEFSVSTFNACFIHKVCHTGSCDIYAFPIYHLMQLVWQHLWLG